MINESKLNKSLVYLMELAEETDFEIDIDKTGFRIFDNSTEKQLSEVPLESIVELFDARINYLTVMNKHNWY